MHEKMTSIKRQLLSMLTTFVLSMRRNKHHKLNNCPRNLCISINVFVVILICLNTKKSANLDKSISAPKQLALQKYYH